jgi:A/G-specific adenine glycosylase
MTDFHKILTLWYQQNRRDLPWRATNAPYSVWVSEIILQQTRIEQGKAYYLRFMERFPDIASLATAREQEVLKIWQGLGYYSRARNMHQAARQIMQDFNGQFPASFHEIRKLKGIGDYTAAAIASISFGSYNAAVDGNVYRVLSRIFGITTPIDSSKGKKEFSTLAHSLLDKENPGLFNEALMEFGALQCIPRNPSCLQCPFQNRCIALKNKQVEQFPVKSKLTKLKNRYFNYLFISHEGNFYIEKRQAKDIWHNLYQLPLIETDEPTGETELISSPEFRKLFDGIKVTLESVTPEIIHPLTHQRLHIRFFQIRLIDPCTKFLWILTNENDVSRFPVPKPIDNYLANRLLINRSPSEGG